MRPSPRPEHGAQARGQEGQGGLRLPRRQLSDKCLDSQVSELSVASSLCATAHPLHTIHSLKYSVPLFLKRRRDRTPGHRRQRRLRRRGAARPLLLPADEQGGPQPLRRAAPRQPGARGLRQVAFEQSPVDIITRTSHYESFTMIGTGYVLNTRAAPGGSTASRPAWRPSAARTTR